MENTLEFGQIPLDIFHGMDLLVALMDKSIMTKEAPELRAQRMIDELGLSKATTKTRLDWSIACNSRDYCPTNDKFLSEARKEAALYYSKVHSYCWKRYSATL